MHYRIGILLSLFSLYLLVQSAGSCQKGIEKHPEEIDFSKIPLPNLSDYGFFKGAMANMEPNTNVLPYEPAATLFTDYAFKKRLVWMPAETSATGDPNQPDEPLQFPDKTVLIKNFYYPEDFAKPDGQKRILETRLLVKNNGVWNAYPYRWNDNQTDATYKVTGEIIDVAWKDETGAAHAIKYAMPNKNQCKSCHNQDGVFMPIGPKLKQLNHPYAYADGSENQLDRWVKVGYLKGPVEKDKIVSLVSLKDPAASVAAKARSYLDVNCGHCHRAKGPAATSGLRLNYEENDPYHWGVKKSPVAAGIGAGDFLFDIFPGKADESIAIFRMSSTNPGIMMPEIGRVSVHTEGVELIRQWINGLNAE